MADGTKPLTGPAMFTVPATDPSKINPMGVGADPEITKNYQEYLEANKEYLESLRRRFEQPNWFKVAAGFAKPQLGGFLASLGSAAEALGENVEQARAIEPTIAELRARIAQGNIALAQRTKAAGVTGRAIGEKRLPTGVEAGEVAGLTKGPETVAEAGQQIETAQLGNFLNSLQSNRSYLELVKEFGKDFVDRTLPAMLTIPGIKPPAGYTGAGAATMTPMPGQPSAPTAAPAAEAGATPVSSVTKRKQIPGIDVDALNESQYLSALKQYNELQQDRYRELAKETQTTAKGGQRVYEVAQQIHDVASDPVLTPIFAQFEKGNPAGILGQMLESQSLSSTLANMRQYVTSARLGMKEKENALTKLNTLENLMGNLQTEMQSAIINPSNLRTEYEKSSLPNLRNTQDAFLRGIRYIANEGLTKYENQLALQRAYGSPQFDPNYWAINPEYSSTIHNASERRNAIIQNQATRDRPAFMRGSIDEVAYRGQKKEAKPEKRRLTAKELREQAGKD